jgi:hypothetical protein
MLWPVFRSSSATGDASVGNFEKFGLGRIILNVLPTAGFDSTEIRPL